MISVSLPFSLSQFISSIPLPENEKSARYDYLAYCYGKDKVLGEHYTSLLADFFGLKPDDLIEIVHRLSIYLRAYTVVDDDLMDTPPHEADCLWSWLRSVFQERICEQANLLSDRGVFADTIIDAELSIYQQCSAAYKRHHEMPNVKDLTKSYINAYADRMATARVPITILGTVAGEETLTSEAQQGIDNLMRALQLLDDLVDCEDDIQAGRFTYPLLCCAVSGRGLYDTNISNELFCSSPANISFEDLANPGSYAVMKEQLELASAVLGDASAVLTNGKGHRLTSFVEDTRQRLAAVLSDDKSDSCQADLLKRLRRSGAAPIRSTTEKGIRHGFGS